MALPRFARIHSKFIYIQLPIHWHNVHVSDRVHHTVHKKRWTQVEIKQAWFRTCKGSAMARQRQATRIHAPRKEAAAPLCSPRPHTLSTDCATASLLAAGVALVGMVMLTRVNPHLHISFWDADPPPDVHGSSSAAPAVTLPTLPLHRHLGRIAAFEAAGELIEAVAYTTAVRGVANSTTHTLSTLDVLGRLQRALRLHGDAYATHATALALKGQSGATVGQYLIRCGFSYTFPRLARSRSQPACPQARPHTPPTRAGKCIPMRIQDLATAC
jgi:hypothetical protein